MARRNRDPNSGTHKIITLRSIQQELHAEIEKKNDDANQVLRILEKHRFDKLSESAKFKRLCGDSLGGQSETYEWIMGSLMPTYYNIMGTVVKGDNIRIMRALLPKIPVCFMLSLKYNPGPSPKAARKILLRNKGRWNVRKCECKSHAAPSTEAEEVCSLEKHASIVLAARLFNEGCDRQSGRCMLYLLSVCPELLSIKEPASGLTLALINIPALGEVILDKQMMQYLKHRIGDILDVLTKLSLPRFQRKYFYVFTTIAVELFQQEIFQYRVEYGRSILHKICLLLDWECEDMLWYIQHLMQLGFDPAVTDYAGRTALDGLFRRVREPYRFHSSLLPYRFHSSNSDTERNQNIVQLFLLYAHAMLPHFEDEAMKNLALSRPCFQQSPNFEENFFNVCRVFLDVTIFPHSRIIQNFCQLIATRYLRAEPLTMLLHREMCKGLEVTRPYRREGGGEEEILIDSIWRQTRYFVCYSRQRVRLNERPTTVERCLWRTLELIVHSTASIGELDHSSLINQLLSSEHDGQLHVFGLDTVRMVIKMLWMYVPSRKADVTTFLQKLSTHTDANTRDTATELLHVVRSVPPLQMLCRISIVRRLKYADIPKLGLADRIQQYLQLGDMSDDHPMRIAENIIDAQQL